VAGRNDRVRLDLNNAEFQESFLSLEIAELKQVMASLRRLRGLGWQGLYEHSGFRWEAIAHIRAPNGAKAYSVRLSRRIRAIVYRDGDFLRFISLHADHDSAYER